MDRREFGWLNFKTMLNSLNDVWILACPRTRHLRICKYLCIAVCQDSSSHWGEKDYGVILHPQLCLAYKTSRQNLLYVCTSVVYVWMCILPFIFLRKYFITKTPSIWNICMDVYLIKDCLMKQNTGLTRIIIYFMHNPIALRRTCIQVSKTEELLWALHMAWNWFIIQMSNLLYFG